MVLSLFGCKEKVEEKPIVSKLKNEVKATPVPTHLKVEEPLIGLPLKPLLPKIAIDFIWQEETGGYAYYQKRTKHLEWPKGFSGVTGAGFYDAGYHSKNVILLDWSKLNENWLNRFAKTSGITGAKAGDLIPSLKDIIIDWDYGKEVFNNVFIPQFYELTRKSFPGFDDIDPVAQGVLVALIENRGNSFSGKTRVEMRNIRDLVPKKDYEGIAKEIIKSKRLWINTGQDGLLGRRDREAALIRTCIKN